MKSHLHAKALWCQSHRMSLCRGWVGTKESCVGGVNTSTKVFVYPYFCSNSTYFKMVDCSDSNDFLGRKFCEYIEYLFFMCTD
jgi:hypothetical protein